MEIDDIAVDAVLADSVAASENKLYVQGGGFDTIFSLTYPARHPRLGVGVILQVPYTATNKAHTFSLSIVDADGHAITLREPVPGNNEPLTEISGPFTLGRPPQLVAGETQPVPIAVNIDGLSLPGPGFYSVTIKIDGVEAKRLPLKFKVINLPIIQAPQHQ